MPQLTETWALYVYIFYVDDVGAWQNLPIDYTSWHAGQKGKADAYGSAAGNMQTISIECIMNGSGDKKDCQARDNAHV